MQNEYDETGQLKNKKLGTDPINTSSPLETLSYDYNVRGWLLGINKDYVNNTNNSRYFGQTLSYDYGFTAQQYDGNIAGFKWRSKGDGEQRAYGFEYDNTNRLLKSDFTQNNGGWNLSAGIDFSVGGNTTGKMKYDANGNIEEMKQMGWKVTGSTAIDNMQYSYNTNSNKLLAVNEISLGITDNKLGDFTDKNTNLDDYTYDVNGNLSLDKNKSISSITYNHLNLPYVITVTGKGNITYTYDAAGNKLMKKVVEGTTTKTTNYIGGFIYEKTNDGNDELQFFAHEEGRIRKKGDTSFVYDYFIKDHLGNVRAVLTEEQKQDAYPAATMETAQSTTEELLYTNVNSIRNDLPSGYPSDSYTNPNNKVAKTSGSGNKIGPAITLKVMAGDKFNLRVSSWYKLAGSTPNAPNPITDLATALANGLGAVAGSKFTSQELSNSGVLSPGATSFLSSQSYSSGKPKAYVNWILFDEQSKYVSSSSGFEQVGNDQQFKVHQFNELPINKNGYLYVYVSNETPNIDVFFDNLQVTHTRGPLLEETHYYPFGLTMAGISSKASVIIENKIHKFQGQELNSDFALNLYEFKWRCHDPQIGRFIQIDPIASEYEYNSTYAFSENRVTASVEIEGLEAKDLYFELGPIRDKVAKDGLTPPATPAQKALDAAMPYLATLFAAPLPYVALGIKWLSSEGEAATTKTEAELPPSSLADKKVPSPNGRNGNEPHQKTIDQEEKKMIEDGFNEIKREAKVATPGGTKNTRYVDIKGTNTKTGETKMVQVGKQNKNQTPVSREVKAINDIENATKQKVTFVPYNNVNEKTLKWQIMKN